MSWVVVLRVFLSVQQKSTRVNPSSNNLVGPGVFRKKEKEKSRGLKTHDLF